MAYIHSNRKPLRGPSCHLACGWQSTVKPSKASPSWTKPSARPGRRVSAACGGPGPLPAAFGLPGESRVASAWRCLLAMANPRGSPAKMFGVGFWRHRVQLQGPKVETTSFKVGFVVAFPLTDLQSTRHDAHDAPALLFLIRCVAASSTHPETSRLQVGVCRRPGNSQPW